MFYRQPKTTKHTIHKQCNPNGPHENREGPQMQNATMSATAQWKLHMNENAKKLNALFIFQIFLHTFVSGRKNF